MFIKINSLGGDPNDFITIKALASIISNDSATLKKNINAVHYAVGHINPKIDEADLDYCHPHPDSDSLEDEKTGPKFIVFNEKCESFIKEFTDGE